MKTEYQIAIEELNNDSGKVVSMAFVEWWLLKYGDLYRKTCKTHRHFSALPDSDGGSRFLKAYFDLNEVSACHKLEAICEVAIKEYEVVSLRNSTTDIIDWCIKYEKLGSQDALAINALFATERSLKSNNFQVPAVDIEIDGNDFCNTTSLLELFDVYYEHVELIAKLRPDSLAAEAETRRANSLSVGVSPNGTISVGEAPTDR